MSTKKKILIVGGAGFIGANLARRLADDKNFEVHVFLLKRTDLWRIKDIMPKLKIHLGDLLNFNELRRAMRRIRPHYIFHLALYGGYPSQADVKKTFSVNVDGTVNLLRAAEEVGFERFVSAGSSSEYGKKKKAMKEGDILEPNSVYGVSKAASTLYCQHRGRDANLPITILRFFSVYGPWEEPGRLIPTIVLRFLHKEPLEFVSRRVARDFTHVDDVVDACLAVLKVKNIYGQIFNICTGKQKTLADVARVARKNSYYPLKVNWGSYKGRTYDMDIWVGNVKKAEKLLGWKAKINFEQGFKRTLEWFKKNKKYYAN